MIAEQGNNNVNSFFCVAIICLGKKIQISSWTGKLLYRKKKQIELAKDITLVRTERFK